MVRDGAPLSAWSVFDSVRAPAGDVEAMAADVLALAGTWLQERRGDAASAIVRARLQQVLSLAEPGSSLALRLRARLVAETDFAVGESAGILALVEEARGASDPVAHADVLSAAVQCLLGPDQIERRRALATDLIGLSVHTGRDADVLMGALAMTSTLFLEGDVRAERGLAELRELAVNAEQPGIRLAVSAIDVMLTVRAGRLADAERMAQDCARQGRQARHPDAGTWFAAHMVMIRWFQGRTPELIGMLERIVNSPMLTSVDFSYLSALAMARALAGDQRGATRDLARLRQHGLAQLPRTCNWMTMMPGIVTTARLLDDVEVALEAYELLLPYAHRPQTAGLGFACFGSVQPTLGGACLTAGKLDQAVEHFREGVRDNEALGHWPALALARRQYAYALGLRGGPRDLAESQQALRAATEDARQVGIPLYATPRPAPAEPARCTREGDRWLISWKKRVVAVEPSVGVRHLAMLLAKPGTEISAADLVAGLAGARAMADAAPDQPVLDRLAVQQYRERVAQLEAELAAPASRGGRQQDAAQAERDWLLAELSGARGVRGQSRAFTDNVERARIAVTRAIHRALERIEAADAIVGAHLRSTVYTGGRCCYRVGL